MSVMIPMKPFFILSIHLSNIYGQSIIMFSSIGEEHVKIPFLLKGTGLHFQCA